MRLYNTEGATQVDDPEFGTFKPGVGGAFDGLPDGMYAKLYGRPGWENEPERVARLAAEQLEKMRDPATMLAELQKMSAGQGAVAALLAQALGVTPHAAAEVPIPAAASEEAPPPAPEVVKRATDPESESQAPAEPAEAHAPAKMPSGRGRGGKTAKTAVSEVS